MLMTTNCKEIGQQVPTSVYGRTNLQTGAADNVEAGRGERRVKGGGAANGSWHASMMMLRRKKEEEKREEEKRN